MTATALPPAHVTSRPTDAATLLNQLRWRYAVKKFDASRRIPEATWDVLEEALVLAPSSYGLEPWKFLVIDDPETRQKLVEASWGQRQLVDASHVVVFAVRKDVDAAYVERFVQRIAKARGLDPASLDAYKQMMLGAVTKPAEQLEVWLARQVYIALGHFLASAALLGVDACPMEGIVPARYDELLGLGQRGLKTLLVATAGYRAADDRYASLAKVRFARDEVIEHVR